MRTIPTVSQIDALIRQLKNAETDDEYAFNQYSPHDPNNAIRRANLRLYLLAMRERMPRTLLVMEAAGYRGGRLTGVPVTSRRVLLQGIPELDMFGVDKGFHDVNDVGLERVNGEPSATIVWGMLAELGVTTFIWNTYPFHPHKAGEPLTNRTPRKSESGVGAYFLKRIINLWQFDQIVAVGNIAFDSLTKLGITCLKVRHPSRGGKNEFVAGMLAILTSSQK